MLLQARGGAMDEDDEDDDDEDDEDDDDEEDDEDDEDKDGIPRKSSVVITELNDGAAADGAAVRQLTCPPSSATCPS